MDKVVEVEFVICPAAEVLNQLFSDDVLQIRCILSIILVGEEFDLI